MDGEAIRCELGRYFLIDLNKHVMTALHDRLVTLAFTDTVCDL